MFEHVTILQFLPSDSHVATNEETTIHSCTSSVCAVHTLFLVEKGKYSVGGGGSGVGWAN